MPGAIVDEVEVIIEDVGGGGGGKPPARDGGDDGDRDKRRRDDGGDGSPPNPRRYQTAITLGIVSILMFFMALASAFIVRKAGSQDWVPLRIPVVLWVNTTVLLASSAVVELARHRMDDFQPIAFRRMWHLALGLGLLFLLGQFVAWRQLASEGVFIASNPASSFFYILTGAHAAHLAGGLAAMVYVTKRNFARTRLTQRTAVQVTAYFWHFLDALWVFVLVLLYLGSST
jgi:cytochrome c oxidase subunit III